MYQSVANKGFAIAQHNLAILYDNGRGVSQNYEEAVRLYRLAAEQGFAQSQRNLGAMYDKGQGITADVIRAYMWSSISANAGNTDAATTVGGSASKGKHNKYVSIYPWITRSLTTAKLCKSRLAIYLTPWLPAMLC
jgi:TPR repeat protein